MTASPSERSDSRMAECPPRVFKAWHLGMARKQRAEARQHSVARVASSLVAPRYVFPDLPARWQEVPWGSMSEGDQA